MAKTLRPWHPVPAGSTVVSIKSAKGGLHISLMVSSPGIEPGALQSAVVNHTIRLERRSSDLISLLIYSDFKSIYTLELS